MKRLRKPIAWILSVMMILTTLPITALADEVTLSDSSSTTLTVTSTPELEVTPTPEPEATPTPEPEATPTPEPEATPTPEPEATPTPEPEATPTPEPEATPSPEPEATPSPKPEATPSPKPEQVPGYQVAETDRNGNFLWPVPGYGTVSQGYDATKHTGIDISAEQGIAVIAAADGTVSQVQTWDGSTTTGDQSYGNMVQITHADERTTLYAHLSKVLVSSGDSVSAGETIGYVGNTGNADGAHLHFEVRQNGQPVDPRPFITGGNPEDPQKKFEELLEKYGGYIAEDGQLRTLDGREAIDKPLAEIAAEAGLNVPMFYASNVTVSEPRSTYLINIGYTTDVEGATTGWGGKRVNGKVAYCVEHGIALGLGDNDGYTPKDLTKEQLAKLTLIDYWGRYKNIANIKGCSAVNYNWDTIEVSAEYLAEFYCQLLIWETINSFGGDFVGASSVSIQSTVGGMANIASQSTYNAFKKAVLAKVDQFYTTPSIANETVTLKVGETKTLTDTTGALAAYKDTPSANTTGISVTKQGNTITLKATGTPKEQGSVVFGYNIDRAYDDQGPGYYYQHAVSQDVTTCGFASRDPAYITINVKVELDGSMKIVKTSEDGKVSGVRFRVTGNGVDTTVQTGTDGTITVPNLKAGSYTVTELDVPDQYVQPKSQTVTVEANKTATVSFSNVLKKWKATITKVDAETGAVQGDASLAGAVYGVYRGSDLIDQYTTNASGQITTKEYVCGDNWYIQEISPSSGYLLDTTKYPVGAEPDKYTLEHNQIPIGVKEQAIKGKIQIHKQYETLEGTPKDEAAAEFQVYLKSAGSYDKAKASERDTIITSASGYAVTKNMPYGTYIVHQTKGGAGREFVDDFEVVISANNQTYSYELLNELKNGQLKIIKTSDDGKVEGIRFRVTRLADNYSKVYTTDASGLILTETLPIFEDNEGKTKYQYRVEELDTEETFGYTLPDPQIVTLEEGDIAEVNFHNVPLKIGTTAKFEDGTKDTQSAQDIVLVDTVRYTGLQVGKEYKVSGVLMDKATGAPFLDFDGNEVKAETTFTPESRDGTVDVIFKFNSLNIKQDTDVVVYETLYREDIELATHAQIDDEGQTVKIRVPEIGTTATSEDGHRVDPLGEVTIFDEVSYTNLKPGKEYTVSGVLMDKATGKAFLDADGKEIKAETTFTPTQPDGTVTVEFVFNATGLHGKEVVAFETLYYEGIELATHAEINDEGQTVELKNPQISTVAVTEDGSKTTLTADDVQITDTISYSDLTVGVEYRMTGILMDKTSGVPFLDFNGNEVTAEATFTPTDADGTVELTFTFDSRLLTEDTMLVVFDELYRADTLLAVHKDIDAEDQTVEIRVPKIGTTATFEDGEKEIIANEEITIIDSVAYSDLKPGKEYTVSGVLMDKETGKAFLDINGEEVRASTTFVPEEPTGTVDVLFKFNAVFVQDETDIVVFEDLYHKGIQLATHAEINDEGQTVTVNPLHGYVQILKKNNMDNSPLANTKFGIFRADTDELVEELVTSSTGQAKSGALLYGAYYLMELEPSSGFFPSDKHYEFFIGENEEVISFEITNTAKIGKMDMSYKEGNTPKTGDDRPLSALMLIFLFSGISAVAMLIFLKKRKSNKKFFLPFLVLLLFGSFMLLPTSAHASTVDNCEITVEGDTLTATKEYVTKDKSAKIEFEDHREEKGKDYKLTDVSYSVISQEEIIEEKEVSLQIEETVGSKTTPISETHTENDLTYQLQDVQYTARTVDDFSADIQEDVFLGSAVFQPEADTTHTVPFFIEKYDLTVDCPLSLSSVTSSDPYWVDDVRIPVTIYGVDALYIEFNGQVIPFDGETPPLSSYESLYLDYLNLNPELYRLNSVSWNGDSYNSNGTVCRDAIISGERLVRDFTAHYGGSSVLLPEFTVYDAVATYTTMQPYDTGETEYTIRAEAHYTVDHGLVPVVVAAIGVIAIAAAVVSVLIIIAKKKKKKNK